MFNAPPIVLWIIAITCAVHGLRYFLPIEIEYWLLEKLAYIPVRYASYELVSYDWAATILSPFGYTLLHANLMHLFMNMAFLLSFGAVAARRMDTTGFMLLYLLSALGGASTIQLLDYDGTLPVIGASGAVSGLVGAVAAVALWPRADRPPPPRPFNQRSLAISFVVIWTILNIGVGFVPVGTFGEGTRVSWEAHLGGFVIGFILMRILDGWGLESRNQQG